MQTLAQLKSGELKGFTRVKISEGLTVFPTELYELSDTLTELDLSGNHLAVLPDDFGKLNKLKIFFASNNDFETLPSVLGQCPNLDMIGFKANRISEIGEHSLPINTRWLILTDNKLRTLPNSFGELLQLKKLMLAGNRLQELPKSMASCRELELIRISANRLSSLPDWLLQLPKLSWIAFSGNPLCANFIKVRGEARLPKVRMNDFKLGELLGQGASGEIYKAHYTGENLNEEIAVKLFKGHVTSDGYPEDEMIANINVGPHANLVKVVAQLDDNKQKGLLMKLIPSSYTNLGLPPSFVTCTRDNFEPRYLIALHHVVKIIKQISDVLLHMHTQKISHGDLYAHNILLNDNANVLLGDFGAASHFSHLPVHQQSDLLTIEKRGLGHLLEDLLCICKDKHDFKIVHNKLNAIHRELTEPNQLNITLSELSDALSDMLINEFSDDDEATPDWASLMAG